MVCTLIRLIPSSNACLLTLCGDYYINGRRRCHILLCNACLLGSGLLHEWASTGHFLLTLSCTYTDTMTVALASEDIARLSVTIGIGFSWRSESLEDH